MFIQLRRQIFYYFKGFSHSDVIFISSCSGMTFLVDRYGTVAHQFAHWFHSRESESLALTVVQFPFEKTRDLFFATVANLRWRFIETWTEMSGKTRIFKHISKGTEEDLLANSSSVGYDILQYLIHIDEQVEKNIRKIRLEKENQIKSVKKSYNNVLNKFNKEMLEMDINVLTAIAKGNGPVKGKDCRQDVRALMTKAIRSTPEVEHNTPVRKTRSTVSVLASSLKKTNRMGTRVKHSSCVRQSATRKVQTKCELKRLFSSVLNNDARLTETPVTLGVAKSREKILILANTGNTLASIVQKITKPTVMSLIVADGKISLIGADDIY